MIKQLIKMPSLKLQKIDYSDDVIRIYASIKSRRARCPVCGRYSKRVHDYYFRTITDLPVFQNRTVILLKTRKFKCGNNRCHRKVFSEQTPDIIRYSRRTSRATRILETFSIELTGRLGSILSKQMHLAVSSSTITRIAYSQQLPDINQPRVLGVDDWAYRKGVSYGTILIDMETSRPIELLPSRDGLELKNWLMKYNDVQIVTRDRASSYASATEELLELPDHESVINTKPKDKMTVTENIEPVITKADQRLERFNKVKELQAKGFPRKRISRDLKMSNNTVRSYFLMDTLPSWTRPKTTNFDLFTDHVLSRIKTDGYILKDIYDEITEMGFKGEISQARHNINMLKEQSKISTSGFSQIQSQKIPYIRPLSSRKLAKYIGSRLTEITDHYERYYLQTLLDNSAELRIVRKLVQIFKTMLSRGRGNIKRWIDFIIRSKHKLSGLKTFARGMLRDIEAVENGINMSWSNGAVEGHVNRIKSIKRQMYGRASFELLRKKVILSQSG